MSERSLDERAREAVICCSAGCLDARRRGEGGHFDTCPSTVISEMQREIERLTEELELSNRLVEENRGVRAQLQAKNATLGRDINEEVK